VPKDFGYRPESLATVYAAMRFGEIPASPGRRDQPSLENFVFDTFQRLGIPVEMLDKGAPGLLPLAMASMTGVLGEPDEIKGSAEETIKQARRLAFEDARVGTRHLSRTMRRVADIERLMGPHSPRWLMELSGPFRQIAAAIRFGSWRIIVFVQKLHEIHLLQAAHRSSPREKT
jgi:hypothetical protein